MVALWSARSIPILNLIALSSACAGPKLLLSLLLEPLLDSVLRLRPLLVYV